MTDVMPKGIDRAAFAAALAEFRAAIGNNAVFDTSTALGTYADRFAMSPSEAHAPSAAVAPASVQEIVAVLRIARSHKIPLWVISAGRNLGYGQSAPRQSGCVVLDLKRMNRILEVNEKLAYAIVEPGVSYFDLYNHLRRTGSKLWIDCAAPGWGSVVGNMLDRGVGYTPAGEHFMSQLGMEIVLADGTLVETGLGSLFGSGVPYVSRHAYGPYLDGLFTQSNFGVVTKVAFQLMPEPPGYRPYLVTFEQEDDIEKIIEVVRPLKLAMLIPNAATSTELIWEAAVSVSKAQYHKGAGPLPQSARRRLMDDLGCGAWNFYGALYGPDSQMDKSWKVIEESFRSIKGARFFFEADRGKSIAFAYRAKLMRGIPNMTEFGTCAWLPDGAHVGFGPVIPVDGKLALQQYRLLRDKANAAGFDYNGEFIIGWRDMHHIFMPIFSRSDESQKARMHALIASLIDETSASGQGTYRTHLDFMDHVASTFRWNDGALAKINHRLKAALDPDGILSPGKSGIWSNAGPGARS